MSSTAAPTRPSTSTDASLVPLAAAGSMIPPELHVTPSLPPSLPPFLDSNGALVLADINEEDPNDEDDDDLPVGPGEQHYIYKSRDIKTLVILTRGLLEEDGVSQLIDIGIFPWSTVKPIANIKPTSKDLRDEIERRWNTFVGRRSSASKLETAS